MRFNLIKGFRNLAFDSLEKTPKINYIPDWLRKLTLRSLRSFTKQTFHGPIEFFLTVMAMDMIAPEYGIRTLKEFFTDLNKQEKKKTEKHEK